MGGFLNHKHACSSNFSFNLCTAAVFCLFISLLSPLLPSPTVSVSVHPVSQIRFSTSRMANNLLSSNPVLSYSTPWFYPGPTAHCIADLPQSMPIKRFYRTGRKLWVYHVNPLTCNQDSRISWCPNWCPKFPLIIQTSISTPQFCSSLINIQTHLLTLNTIYPFSAKTGSPLNMVLSHFYYNVDSSELSFQPSQHIPDILSDILGILYDYFL